jgi:hypothetical protein
MKKRLIFPIALFLFASTSVLGEDFEIRIVRQMKVGERVEVNGSAQVSEHAVTSAMGNVVQENKKEFEAEFVGVLEALGVNDEKNVIKYRITVNRCLMTPKGAEEPEELLASGTEVVAELVEKEESYTVDGEDVSPQAKKVLGLFVDFRKQTIDEDETFGTKERKKVGDSWPIDAEKTARSAKDDDIEVEAADIEGSTTVVDRLDVDGVPCLEMRTLLKIKKIAPPLPPSLKIEKSGIEADFQAHFPVDVTKLRLWEKTKMTVHMEAKGQPSPQAPEIHVVVKNSEAKEIKRKYVQ